MQGAVPAAGEGTRLRPHTADTPKGLVEVAGSPLLAHVFETLVDSGCYVLPPDAFDTLSLLVPSDRSE